MTQFIAPGRAREGSIEITVIRANGTTEQLGVVSYWHRNPFKRFAWRLRRWLGFN